MTVFKNLLQAVMLFGLLSAPFFLGAQNRSLDWINSKAYELHSDSGFSDRDFSFLHKILKGKTLVGLGEASHGTEEFFYQKARMVQYLVSREGFRLLALESPDAYIEPINTYIQSGQGDLRAMLQSMGLYNSLQIYKLCDWLRSYNTRQPVSGRVRIIGFDREEYWGDPFGRDEKMAKQFIESQKVNSLKSILWSHNLHLAEDVTMSDYKAMGFYLKEYYNEGYFSVAFDTWKGKVNVLKQGVFESHEFVADENTFSALFSKAKFETFFIDFMQPDNPLRNNKNYISNFYSNWKDPKQVPVVPGLDFDAIVFIRHTTASKKPE